MYPIIDVSNPVINKLLSYYFCISIDSLISNKANVYFYDQDIPELIISYPTPENAGFIKRGTSNLTYQTNIDSYLKHLESDKVTQIYFNKNL